MTYNDGIHHVLLCNGRAYCGRKIEQWDWHFTDKEHALAAIDQETYAQPCKKCMNKILEEETTILMGRFGEEVI